MQQILNLCNISRELEKITKCNLLLINKNIKMENKNNKCAYNLQNSLKNKKMNRKKIKTLLLSNVIEKIFVKAWMHIKKFCKKTRNGFPLHNHILV
jgi:hypothetical protein